MKVKNKICLILFILIIVSTVSAIHASDDFNCTTLSDDTELVELNESLDNSDDIKIQSSDDSKPNITIEQGDDLPIKINGNVSGDLFVSIDNKYHFNFDFKGNEILNIPSIEKNYYYNFNNLFGFDQYRMNLKEGIHSISFTFHLNSIYSNYKMNVTATNSTLTFDFSPNNYLTRYKYETNINVLKKDKTVHILNIEPAPVHQVSSFKVKCDNDGQVFLIIVSKDGRVVDSWFVSKKDKKIIEFDHAINSFGNLSLTVVNIEDGTNDTASFTVDNDYTKIINYTYVIKNNNITFCIELQTEHNKTLEARVVYFKETAPSVWYLIDVKSIKKNIIVKNYNHKFYLEFEFNNLAVNNYDFEFSYNIGDYYEFLLRIPFEIKPYSNNESSSNESSSNNESIPNPPINETVINETADNKTRQNNNSFTDSNGNSNYSNLANNNGNSHYHQNPGETQNIKDYKITNFGDVKQSGSKDADFSKSYELSKSVSKSTNNILTIIGLTIIAIISLVIGYFKFKTNL